MPSGPIDPTTEPNVSNVERGLSLSPTETGTHSQYQDVTLDETGANGGR